MSSDEFDWILSSLVGRAPFQPFTIEFMNGKRIEVRHPEAVGFWRNIIMFRSPRGVFHLFTPDAICRMSDIEHEDDFQL